MRIKIFAHPNSDTVERTVNEWLQVNNGKVQVLNIVYADNGVAFSVMIQYRNEY